MKFNIVFGGQAGQGPNILTHLLGETLVKQGYYVFYSRDYQSLIRGGHNFNVLTFSDKPVYSNDSKIDILIAIDENTLKIHKSNLKDKAIILSGHTENMYYAGRLFKILGIEFKLLEEKLKELKARLEENIKAAKEGYEEEKRELCKISLNKNKNYFIDGNDGIAQGAIKSGLDTYFAYPMTPSTSVLGKLASEQINKNYIVLEMENEISVINTAVGSAITGAKAMIGTSGGGFDLMTEAISMTGMAEIPLVLFLSQRPGPGSGVPTYTSQGDLNMARHCGHGEFQRVIVAPGDPLEAEELTSQAFYFAHKYKIPSIILSDKHLGESFYTIGKEAKITKSTKLTVLTRFNSYEKDASGASTEDPEIIKNNIERRLKKVKEIEKDSLNFESYKIYGKKNSKNIVLAWGSTKGAILDAINDLDCSFLQVLYIEPFAEKIKDELKNKNIILVENNLTGALASLLAEKTGIFIEDKNKILRYDGRPFLCDELNAEIKKRLK